MNTEDTLLNEVDETMNSNDDLNAAGKTIHLTILILMIASLILTVILSLITIILLIIGLKDLESVAIYIVFSLISLIMFDALTVGVFFIQKAAASKPAKKFSKKKSE